MHYSRCPAWFLLVWLGPFCFGQVITIRVINANNGHPLKKQQVSVSLLYEKDQKPPVTYDAVVRVATDAEGKAQFDLPAPPLHTCPFRLT